MSHPMDSVPLQITLPGQVYAASLAEMARSFAVDVEVASDPDDQSLCLCFYYPSTLPRNQVDQALKKLEMDLQDLAKPNQPKVAAYLPATSAYKPEENAQKQAMQSRLYQFLQELSPSQRPWGALTGIRPSYLPTRMLANGLRPDEISSLLVTQYQVKADKAALALELAQVEAEILGEVPPRAALIYVGIPICPSRCTYCSFVAQDAKRYMGFLDTYVEAILQEVKGLFQVPRWREVYSYPALYIGGGTPSILSEKQLEYLLKGLLETIPVTDGVEFTVEAGRPDTLNREKLEVMASAGVNRLCLNPQTLSNATLERVNRRHTAEDFFRIYELARTLPFADLNADLIMGLPGEGPEDFLTSVRGLLALDPPLESLTLHSLALKRAAQIQQSNGAWFLPNEPSPEWEEALGEAYRLLREKSYQPYYLYKQKYALGGLENVGFALPGSRSIYNTCMMSDLYPVLGFGAASSSKKVLDGRVERCFNPKDLQDYALRVEEMVQRKRDLFAS